VSCSAAQLARSTARVNQNGFSDHFAIAMTVTDAD
jgi:hypothetical protein